MAASNSSQGSHVFLDPYMGVAHPVSVTESYKRWPLGFTVIAEDVQPSSLGRYLGAGKFVYCQGSDVTARGQFCHIVSNSAVLLKSDNSASFYPIGLAAGALSGTGAYGWVQVAGLADYASFNTSVAAAGRMGFGSTDGVLGTIFNTDTGTGWRIQGIVPVSSYAAALSASRPNLTVQLQHPFCIGQTGSN